MPELWHAPLEKLRHRFAEEAEGRGTARLKIVLTSDHGVPATPRYRMQNMISFAMFIRRNPTIWWIVTFEASLDPKSGRGAEFEVFTDLSKQAGAVLKSVPQARPSTLCFDVGTEGGLMGMPRPDDVWYASVFHLAWMELPGSPLRARSWLFPDEPEYPEWDPYGDFSLLGHELISGDEAGRVPLGLRSELVPDPFTASTYAIDALVSNAHQAQFGSGAKRNADSATGHSLEDDPALVALTPNELAIFDALTEEPMTGGDLLAKLAREGITNLDESALSRTCRRPPLRARGVRHRRRAGYYKIPV
jgi:hypothetical protein